MVEHKCQHCGKVFLASPSTVGRFCSRSCLYAYQRNGHQKLCLQCGKPFYATAGDEKDRRRFCSLRCWGKTRVGVENPSWSGNHAGYSQMHRRVRNLLGSPVRCDECGTVEPKRTYEWANITGRFEDPSDYRRMCRKCHRKYDRDQTARGKLAWIANGGTV